MTPRIRLATPADATAVLEIYAPIVESTPISFELIGPSPEEMARRIEQTLRTHPWLVCADDDLFFGYAYASTHRTRPAYQWAVDVSVYVHPRARRRGVARALYTALLSTLAAQGFYCAFAGIAQPNVASVQLHESLGFRPLGIYRAVGYKLGAWYDVGWWQYDLMPRASDPMPPLLLGDIVDSHTLADAIATGEGYLAGP